MDIFKPHSLSSIFSQPQEDKLQTYQEPYAENRITSFVYEEIVLKRLNPFAKIKKNQNYVYTKETNMGLKREVLFGNQNDDIGVDLEADDVYRSE